ncbi:MAG: magnesium/cobalt transporter CorA [Gemmatimonadetes bacterium]|nr:magnesium/cobalt transporter CorA [Gemmatimonadota bacterium]
MAVSEPAVAPAADATPRQHARGLRSWHRTAEGVLATDLSPRELVAARDSGTGQLWVDLDVTDLHQVACLENVFGFHPLAVEDTLSPNSRVKIEDYNNVVFLIVRAVLYRHDTDDPYDIETFNICFFLGKNFLVTTHAGRVQLIEEQVGRVQRSPDLLARGTDRLLHAIVDAAVDAYFPVMDKVDELLDELEVRVIEKFDERAMSDIFALKRLILSLRRHLGPQREVLNIMTNRPNSLLTPDVQVYFRDIYDHLLRINDAIDTYRDLLSSTLDSYLSQVSIRLGRITTGLSVVATLSVPFVVISGMWGMNFTQIPLANEPHGFWWMLAIQLGLGGLGVFLLRVRKWV